MAGRKLATALAALALTGASLVASAPARAGGGHHAGHGYGHVGYGIGYGHGHGYGGGAHVGYGYRFGGHHGRHRSRRHHGGHTAANVLLGVTAGLLFLDVVGRANRHDDAYAGTPRRVYRVAEPPRYAPPPQPTTTAANCLQTREYQTTIVIAGEEKEGYGTACLQPDGSWLMGPPKLVPEYN